MTSPRYLPGLIGSNSPETASALATFLRFLTLNFAMMCVPVLMGDGGVAVCTVLLGTAESGGYSESVVVLFVVVLVGVVLFADALAILRGLGVVGEVDL